ncbi:MAG: (2Fe-2S)-binding protein [Bdellovibrionaceae bacterium]|nr:(2Fe-2S)-binding protein [Pseudobdellovibrionaceae bacterium]
MSSTSNFPNDQPKTVVELEGRDRIEVEGTTVKFRGCSELTNLMKTMRKSFGPDLKAWPLPSGDSHSAILLREMVQKLRGDWNYPYKEVEVCHCRGVSCKTIDEAIVGGAHTTAAVSRQTTASTACGTCRPEVQRMIDYRLQDETAKASLKKSA